MGPQAQKAVSDPGRTWAVLGQFQIKIQTKTKVAKTNLAWWPAGQAGMNQGQVSWGVTVVKG